MGLKRSHLAGWCLFVLLVFLSAFYFLSAHLLTMPAAWGARISVALVEGTAFLGAAVALHFAAKGSGLRRRLRLPSRVYLSFILLLSLTAALGAALLQMGLARLLHLSYRGLGALYPMLVRTTDVPFPLVFLTLILIPALAEELLLRGALFPLFEEEGTAVAVAFSAVCMPLLYVYPSAALPSLLIGLVCALETYYTGSVWPAALTHLLCRLALYGSDLLAARTEARPEIVVTVAVVLFLLSLFSFLRSCEGLLRDGLLEHFQKGPAGAMDSTLGIVRTPGFLLFLLLYLVRLTLTLSGVWR